MRNILWYLIAGTNGGIMRARILLAIKDQPSNAHKIAKKLAIDYKTSRYHLELLEKNKLLDTINKDKYGTVYILSAQLDAEWSQFNEMWKKLEKN